MKNAKSAKILIEYLNGKYMYNPHKFLWTQDIRWTSKELREIANKIDELNSSKGNKTK